MFLKNTWYVAAWDHEVSRQPLARKLLDIPVVLYRTQAGAPVALEDTCPHRYYPLSKGTLKGDALECGYHGMTFDCSGKCVHIPGQDQIPPTAAVRSFPVAERWGWIWIWMGDPALADPAQIVDFHWLDDPAWGAKGDMFPVKCNWQLIVDNLLDLTHLTYVHGKTIGNAATTEGAEQTVERKRDGVVVSRWMIDSPAPPTYVRMGGFTGNVDRWQIIDYTLPSAVRLNVGAAPAGTGARDGRHAGGINMYNLNAVTPETGRSVHYFWAQAHDFSPRDQAVTDRLFAEIYSTFKEDWAILEAQQREIDRDPNSPIVDIRVDAAPNQARRMVDELVAAEASVTRSHAAE
jgi:vanillate O-demethylase monooxygenase subunit